MTGKKNEISIRPKSRHTCRPDVFYFLPTAHFLKQLPTHIAHIAKAPRANTETKALSKSVSVPTHGRQVIAANLKENKTRKINNETLTKAICNKGFSGNSSILPRIKFRVGGQDRCPQSLTADSLIRYVKLRD